MAAQPRVNQTCYAAEDAAQFAKLGSGRAALGAKTQAGYAPVSKPCENELINNYIFISIPQGDNDV